ncbi:MAG: ABC transporter ATP-binding protein [Planctomycetia bacterium]|nr:ABC transporter ATP-binding protein [Planctomycetia bacterium]
MNTENFATETSTRISVQEIVVRYHPNQEPVLDRLSLQILPHKLNVLIGPNGCGKSTLLKAMARQLRLSSGAVFIEDRNINSFSALELSQYVGILFQENFAPNDLTVEELIYYSRYPRLKLFESLREEDYHAVQWAMEITNTLRWRDRMIRELSSGQRQLVWIALIIAQESKCLFLDEPTSYLDMANQIEILDCIHRLNREMGKTIVVSIHDLNMAAQYADWIFAMKDGRIHSFGAPQNIITSELLHEVFDVEAKIIYDQQDGAVYCIPKHVGYSSESVARRE